MSCYRKKDWLKIAIFGFSIGALTLLVGGCYDPAQKKQPQKEVNAASIINEIKSMREDERAKLVYELNPLVLKEAEQNPRLMEGFISEAVDIAVNSSPGLAIHFEKYASRQVVERMESAVNMAKAETAKQLRKSNSVDLLRVEKENQGLKDRLSNLQAEKDRLDRENSQAKIESEKKIAELQRYKDNNSVQPVGHVNDSSNTVSMIPAQIPTFQSVASVPVLLKNKCKTMLAFVKIISEQSGQEWSYIIGSREVQDGYSSSITIYLPPGNYKIELYSNYHGSYVLGQTTRMSVTRYPAVHGGYCGTMETDTCTWARH